MRDGSAFGPGFLGIRTTKQVSATVSEGAIERTRRDADSPCRQIPEFEFQTVDNRSVFEFCFDVFVTNSERDAT
jgi:hypothetical protein